VNLDSIFSGRAVILTADEMAQRVRAAQAGDQAATLDLLCALAPMMKRAIRGAGLPLDEARSAAVRGVLEAIPRAHLGGYGFPAFAKCLVQEALGEDSLVLTTTISIPRTSLKRWAAVRAASRSSSAPLEAVAAEHNMTVDVWYAVNAAMQPATSLEDASGVPASSQHDAADDARLVGEALVELERSPAEQAAAVRLRYGFTDYRPLDHAEIGERLAFSRETSRRRVRAGLQAMRAAVGAPLVSDLRGEVAL